MHSLDGFRNTKICFARSACWFGPCVIEVIRVILDCLCHLYISTRLPKYLKDLCLDCVVNVCITHQDSENLHLTYDEEKFLPLLMDSNEFVQNKSW